MTKDLEQDSQEYLDTHRCKVCKVLNADLAEAIFMIEEAPLYGSGEQKEEWLRSVMSFMLRTGDL